MTLAYITLALLWLSIIAYAVLGGADFGGGVWDALARGPEAENQRTLISKAIGPVWEANNVWIIYLSVGLYTAFPLIAYIMTVTLFVPFIFALIGIVLRGASFAFRAHLAEVTPERAVWGRAFGIASVITPFLLGACAAAVAGDDIRYYGGQPHTSAYPPWLTLFAIVVGLFAVAICAVLAAVYLCVEAERYHERQLMRLFRRRALMAGAVTSAIGLIGLIVMPAESPHLWDGLLNRAWPAALATMLIGLGTAAALWYRRYHLARVLVVLMVALLLGTWGLAQIPYIVPPDVTVADAASPPATLQAFLIAAIVGMAILLPSLYFLFRVFKGQNPVPKIHGRELEGA